MTNAGAEIDMLIFDKKNRPTAIEIKYSSSPKAERGFWNALDDLTCKRGFVVYPGEESYPIAKDIFAIPLKDISRIIQ